MCIYRSLLYSWGDGSLGAAEPVRERAGSEPAVGDGEALGSPATASRLQCMNEAGRCGASARAHTPAGDPTIWAGSSASRGPWAGGRDGAKTSLATAYRPLRCRRAQPHSGTAPPPLFPLLTGGQGRYTPAGPRTDSAETLAKTVQKPLRNCSAKTAQKSHRNPHRDPHNSPRQLVADLIQGQPPHPPPHSRAPPCPYPAHAGPRDPRGAGVSETRDSRSAPRSPVEAL